MILVAATTDTTDNWSRLRAMPQHERQRLAENLKKFDLVYSPDQQRALRDLDRRINELEPARQAQYLSALRHYHNWLDSLPDAKQDALKRKATGERMEMITKLVAKTIRSLMRRTAQFLQFVDVGDYSPFELAAIYQVWQTMSASERQQVEKLQPGPRRKAFLQKGEARQVATAQKRQAFDEVKWVSELEDFAEKRKIGFLLQELKSKEDARPANSPTASD